MRVVGGVLPIDVDAVKAEVFEKGYRGAGKVLAAGGGGGGLGKVGGVGPAADGEEGLELAVFLLEEEELLDATVDVGANIVPGVCWVVFLEVSVSV